MYIRIMWRTGDKKDLYDVPEEIQVGPVIFSDIMSIVRSEKPTRAESSGTMPCFDLS